MQNFQWIAPKESQEPPKGPFLNVPTKRPQGDVGDCPVAVLWGGHSDEAGGGEPSLRAESSRPRVTMWCLDKARLCPNQLGSCNFHFLLWRWLKVTCRALGHCWGLISGPSQEHPSFLKQQVWNNYHLALKSWQLLITLNFLFFRRQELSWAVVA